jgi:hypothetical protein
VNDDLPSGLRRFGVELERAIGRELAPHRRPLSRRARELLARRPRALAGTTVGAAALATTLTLALGATTSAPAFAVTRNHDGTVTISIQRYNGIAGANARLQQLGIRATVMSQAPAGCRTWTISMHGAPPPSRQIASSRWTIDPSQVPAGRTLVLAPPPPGSGKGGRRPHGTPPPRPPKGGPPSRGCQTFSLGTEGAPANNHAGPPPNPGNS